MDLLSIGQIPGEYQEAWIQIVLLVASLALTVASALLAPKPDVEDARAAGLGDFDFPTATEGRALPVIFGKVKILAPNVIWYGDLEVQEIRDSISTGWFSHKSIIVGYRYVVGMNFALCHGPGVTLHAIEIDDRPVWEGTAVTSSPNGTSIEIHKPSLFGGEKKGGGVRGVLQFYSGVEDQEPDPYLVDVLGADVPGYVDVCHAVWRHGHVGESERIRPWAFTLSRYANNLGLDGDHHRIGDDMNPAEVLYEVLTNDVWGCAKDPSEIDIESFRAAGETLFEEGNGFSISIDRARAADEFVQEILRQIDAVLYETGDGVWTLRLVRDDYDVETIPEFDDSDLLELVNFARGSWNQTQNHVAVAYRDRAKNYGETSSFAQDLANVRVQGHQVYSQMSFPGVKVDTTARDIAARELRQVSYPLAKAKLALNRRAALLKPADVFRWSNSRLGISGMVLRVGSIDLGEFASGRVIVEAVQDVFGLGTAAYAPGQETGWTPTSNAPLPATLERVIDAPYWFALTDPSIAGAPGERLFALAGRPNGASTEFVVFVDEGFGYREAGPGTFAPTALVETEYARETDDVDTTVGLRIKSVLDVSRIDDTTAEAIAAAGDGLILVGDEVMAFESITDLGGGVYHLKNVHRGLLDTLPEAHAVDTRVWFIALGIGVSLSTYTGSQSINAKLRVGSSTAQIDLEDATALPLTFDRRAERPLPPGNVRVNGERWPTVVGDDDITVTWAHRNRLDPVIRDQDDGDSPLGIEAGTEYRIVFKALPGGLTLRTETQATTDYTYTRADQTSDNSGVPPQALRLELDSRRTDDGLASRVKVVREFEVFDPGVASVSFDGAGIMSSAAAEVGIADTWSVVAWVKRTGDDTTVRPLFQVGTGANRILVFRASASPSIMRVQLWDSSNVQFKNLAFNGALVEDEWVQIGLTYDGGEPGDPLLVYLNGQLVVPSSSDTDNAGTMTDTARPIILSPNINFLGAFHSFAMWNTVLSDVEMAAIHAGKAGFNLNYDKDGYASQASLRHWFRLGHNSAAIGADYALSPSGTFDLMTNAFGIDASDIVADVPE